MSVDNAASSASELTKLEYALIHSPWEPSEQDIQTQVRRDKDINPYNDNHKPKLRSCSQIIKDLKVNHFKEILS